jgi:PAS domain S-box-containing protein
MKQIKRLLNWLVRPHSRLVDTEDRRGAQLFSGLMLVHFILVFLAINAVNIYYVRSTGFSIWNDKDARIVLAGMIAMSVAIVILRQGFYKLAVTIYIIDTAAVALWAPFAQTPNTEIGLFASATIPVLLSAMIFSYRRVIWILIGIIAAGIIIMSFASLPPRDFETGFALLIVVAITGGLILALKYHLDCLEKERHSQIRKVALKYRNLFNNIADGIFIADQSGRVIEANTVACKQLNYTHDELIGLPVKNISTRPDFDVKWLISELQRTACLSYVTQHRRKDDSVFPVELRLTLIAHENDINIIGVARDITDQQAELSFREAVISHAAEGLCVCHQINEFPFVKFSLWNDRMYEITGYTMEEINQLGWYQTVYPDPELQARAIERMSDMRRGNQLNAEEWVITRKDKQERILEISTSTLKTNDKNEHLLALMHDITKRKHFEKNLTNSEKQYRELFNSVMEGIGLVDKDEIIIFANPAFAKIFEFDSVEALVGKSLMKYIAPESRDILLTQNAMRAKGLSSQYELAIITEKGNSKWIYLAVTPRLAEDGSYAGGLGAVLDITRRKNSEKIQAEIQQKLERAERMESLGLLAGGVAHDLNNMLSPVAGYAELLLREVTPDSKIGERVQKIAKSAHDAANVIQDLLTLARRGRYQMNPIKLNDVILTYLESPGFEDLKQRHPGLNVSLNLCPELGMISGSSPHLSKVIMNLVSNAFEAMANGGTLAIQTEQQYLSALIGGYILPESGEYILVHIKDSGVGISHEDMERIFEPYFSKKKMGRSGSGLGLSVVYGVIKDHHGFYDVFSEPGKGTEFVLYFPVSSVPGSDQFDKPSLINGTETILVVDDFIEQRELSRDILSSLGYSVKLAENGHDAIAILNKQSVNIVLLDMIMEPDFDGLETYREILKINPNQRCVIVSGYAETERVREMLKLGAGPYIRKPFSIDTIGRALREAISDRVCSLSQ